MDAIDSIIHVAVIVALGGPMADDQIALMKTETTAIWRPYGVAIRCVCRAVFSGYCSSA